MVWKRWLLSNLECDMNDSYDDLVDDGAADDDNNDVHDTR